MLISNLGPELAQAAELMLRDVLLVKPGETVLVTADTASDMRVVEAIQNETRNLDTQVALLITPQLPFQGALGDPYISGSISTFPTWLVRRPLTRQWRISERVTIWQRDSMRSQWSGYSGR